MDAEQRRQIGSRITTARKERGWSQARLAEEAGVSENTVMTLESGARATQAAKLHAVMDVLNLATRNEGLIAVEGLQEDSRIFLTVAAKRLAAVKDDGARARILARLYPLLLEVD